LNAGRADHPRSGRLWQIALPATGVLAGIPLIAGPFLATTIRAILDWGPGGAGATVISLVLGFCLRNCAMAGWRLSVARPNWFRLSRRSNDFGQYRQDILYFSDIFTGKEECSSPEFARATPAPPSALPTST
jgi:hypothetical protein